MQLSNIGKKLVKESPIIFRLPSKKKEEIIENVWDGVPIETKNIEGFSYPFETLNPVQSEFYVNRNLDCNFLISAKTSAGKTVIAELAKNGKLLYLSPLKAISQEKYDDWTDLDHTWHKQNISISTGDYQITEARIQEMRDADVIIMTSEMLDSRSRRIRQENNDWLLDIKTLVVDEFHLMGYDGRGDKLESALIRFSQQNPDCRIVCLSATMPNVEQLSTWLTKLNSKKTLLINSDYRPVQLIKEYVPYLHTKDTSETQLILTANVRNILVANPTDKFIVFVHTKNLGAKITESLNNNGIKCHFHSADLAKEERIEIQRNFNSNSKDSLRVVVATSTLAWGVNTPADSTIIAGIHRGFTLVNNQDIHQMCGRAGRVGKTAKGIGKAFILIPNQNTQTWIDYCNRIKNVDSCMDFSKENGMETLCFHIIAEIQSGNIINAETLLNWYNLTFANHQGLIISHEDAEAVLNKLIELKMIKDDFTVTGLGKTSANLYYSPFEINSWYNNFMHLNLANKPFDNVTLAWALGKTFNNENGFVPKPMQDEAMKFNIKAVKYGLSAGNSAHLCAVYYHLLNATDYFPSTLMPVKRLIQNDFDRVIMALKMMDSMYMRLNKQELWNTLYYQVKYGVKEHLIELVQLPQIGAKRANDLYSVGIKTKNDFMTKGPYVRSIIGNKLYDQIIKSIN